jgi:hypothetical protein
MGITCYMVRPTRASCVGISQQWRASLTDGNSVTPAQVTSLKVKDESINPTALAERQRTRLKIPPAECLLGVPEREMSAVGTPRYSSILGEFVSSQWNQVATDDVFGADSGASPVAVRNPGPEKL